MNKNFQQLKKRFHIESEVLSAMIIGYVVLFISGIIFLNQQGNNLNEKTLSKQTTTIQSFHSIN